jgi:TonB family protein
MNYEKIVLRGVAASALFAVAISLATANVRAQETTRKTISNPNPIYPELARKVHLAGTVKVQVVIATDGKIKEVKVVGGHPLLVDAVQDALKSWKFVPASTETTTILQFNFRE